MLSLTLIIISLIVVIILSSYTRDGALRKLSAKEANKTAEIVRESLIAVMRKGMDRESLKEIVQRFNHVDGSMYVRTFRGAIVSKQFGEMKGQKEIVDNDPLLQKAFDQGDSINVKTGSGLRFLFPIKARAECLQCHAISSVGKVHGVIDIAFSTDYLKMPVAYFSRTVVIFLVIVFCLLFLIPFYLLRAEVVRPINSLVEDMSGILQKRDLSRRVYPRGHTSEIGQLSDFLNEMLSMLQMYQHNLEEQSNHDDLTGLFNRKMFEEQLSKEAQRADRYQRAFSLIVLDLDNFRDVNESKGRAAGDQLLKHVGQILRNNVRISDFVARYGSDEFCVLLPETSADLAINVCRKIQRLLKTNPFELEDEQIVCTGNIVLASYPLNAVDTQHLIDVVDKTMQESKSEGANRLAVPGENPSSG